MNLKKAARKIRVIVGIGGLPLASVGLIRKAALRSRITQRVGQ